MKKLFSPLYSLMFVILPQLIALIYLLFSTSLEAAKPLMLPAAAALAAGAFFAFYAIGRRREEALSSRAFIAISAAHALAVIGIILQGFESSSLGFAVSPALVMAAAGIISVIYGVAGIAYTTTPAGKTYDIARYVVGIIFLPAIWFLAFAVLGQVNSNAIFIILIVVSFYALILFASKLLFIWCLRKTPLSVDDKPKSSYYITVFVIALCMPLLGLLINQGMSSVDGQGASMGLFGDFSHPLFYIIAAINGLLLLLPPLGDKKLRLLTFYLKSAGYAYILYFFAVFIPILPIGLIGIIFYGLGLLILAPLMITVLQGYHLVKEGIILAKAWGKPLIAAVFCIGIATLPISMTAVFWGDKANFHEAVQYLEQKDFDSTKSVDLARLGRTLKNIKSSLTVTRGPLGIPMGGTPVISGIYSKLILDGKLLSRDNVLAMENLFFDAGHDLSSTALSNPDIVSSYVRLNNISSETSYDKEIGAYRSWVHMELQNGEMNNGEYVTTFKLPEGAYISDYYLDVLGERKGGMLTDRRAALFIYSKIVNTRRDPGLLHYIGKNTLELRVFPFAPIETRNTGFEIIHSQKLNLSIGGGLISLEGDMEQKELQVPGATLLTASQKQSLRPEVRTPKYYFIIDSSKNSNIKWHIDQVEEYTKKHHIDNAQVIFASYKLQKHTLADMAQTDYKAEGGFNLNMAVKQVLNSETEGSFPIIIAVSDNMPAAVLPRNIYALAGRFPESQEYYALNHNLTLTPYSFEDNSISYTADKGYSIEEPIVNPVLDYNGVYVSDNGRSELVLTDTTVEKPNLTDNQYENAVILDAMARREALTGTQSSLDLIRASFRAKVLTPQTAFIVVETADQEKELLDLQERILNNNEEVPTVTLDEPPLALLILIFALVLLIVNKKLRKTY